jgi:alpha-amylase
MNILGDFINRVNSLYPEDIDNEELNSLLTTIRNQGEEIEVKEKEIVRLQAKIDKIEAASDKLRDKLDMKPEVKKPAVKKTAARKAPTKKTVAAKVEPKTAEPAKAEAKEPAAK